MIVVTGGAGYIGSHLIQELDREHALVVDDLSAGHTWAIDPQFLRRCSVTDGAALRRVFEEDRSGRLADVRRASQSSKPNDEHPAPAGDAQLRKISLSRLEKHLERCAAEGRSPTEEMRNLAGLYRIRYVLLYPDEHDVVLAGPAGPWRHDGEGRRLNVETGQPVVQLDDLVVVFRSMLAPEGGRFGCSITPTLRVGPPRTLVTRPCLRTGTRTA